MGPLRYSKVRCAPCLDYRSPRRIGALDALEIPSSRDRIGKRLPMAAAIYVHLEDYDQALSKNRL